MRKRTNNHEAKGASTTLTPIILDRQRNLATKTTGRISLGRFVVANPRICHGKLTFAGTRIFVADVLELVARGIQWDEIVKECQGSIRREAISEAVLLASRALLDHAAEYALDPRHTRSAIDPELAEMAADPQIQAELRKIEAESMPRD